MMQMRKLLDIIHYTKFKRFISYDPDFLSVPKIDSSPSFICIEEEEELLPLYKNIVGVYLGQGIANL